MADLPTLLEGNLDSAQCDELFADIVSNTDVTRVKVRLKRSPGNNTMHDVDRSTKIENARRLLLEGAASMVQIHYRYQQSQWCDTLLAHSTGVRLIRMQQHHHFVPPEEPQCEQ